MKRNVLIWTVFIIFIIPVYILTWKYNHEIFHYVNGFLNGFLGYPMILFSAMADGLFVLMISSAVYNKKKGFYWVFLLSYLIAAGLVQFVKNTYEAGRPLTYYPLDEIFYAGDILHHQSFPSGHSTAALVLARYLMQLTSLVKFKALFFAAGCLCAISRVYIGAHFPIDVLTGAMTGFIISDFIFFLAKKRESHSGRPEYKYNMLMISVIGITASTIYILFQKTKYAPLSRVITIIAGCFFLFFVYRIISEFFLIYKEFKEK